MRRRRGFPGDPGLAARMLATMFLLGLLYVAFIGLLLALEISYVMVLLIAAGMLFAQYYFSDRIALFAMRAREVSAEEAPGLHGTVNRLCALADMPKPRLAVADADMPNAFATGRSPRAAVLCVTTGLVRRLNSDELEAVLSHELSHIAHRDVAVMTIASFLGVVAGLLTRFAFYSGMFGFGGRRGRDSGVPAVLVIVLASIIVYALSFLLTRALSRYRELSADRSGAILIGRPSSLASALTKITGEMGRIPTTDLRSAEPFNAFFFAPAIARGFSISSLFSTHPPLERRLDQLARLEAELGERP